MRQSAITWAFLALAPLGCLGACDVDTKPNKAWGRCKADPCSDACPTDLREQYCEYYVDDPKCDRCYRDPSDGGTDDGGPIPGVDGGAGRDGGDADACVRSTWYADADGDGLGDSGASTTACEKPAGYVDNANDPYPNCGRATAPAECAPDSVRCMAGSVSGRETCVEDTKFPGCTDWKPSATCNALAPVCSGAGECSKCKGDSDCANSEGKVCNTSTGSCVQCTGAKAAACGGDVCDSLKLTCAVGVKPATADLCESCVSDAHCGKTAPSLCMPTSFGGTSTGNFCLPKRDSAAGVTGSCINDRRPYASTINGGVGDPLASVDGVVTPICNLRATTCEGLNDFSNTSCAGPMDNASCGVAGLADGICAPVPADTIHRCSVPCGGNDDCRVGFTCTGSGYCSL